MTGVELFVAGAEGVPESVVGLSVLVVVMVADAVNPTKKAARQSILFMVQYSFEICQLPASSLPAGAWS